MDLKKLVDGLTRKSEFIVDENAVTLSVGANTYASQNFDISKSGYKPLAIAGLSATTSGNTSITFYRWSLNKNTATIGIRNHSSTTRDMGIKINVLYQKLGGVLTNIVSYIAHLFGGGCVIC